MLRRLVVAAGALLLLGGAVAAFLGAWPAALWLLGTGAVVTAGTLFERVVYKSVRAKAPGAGWMKTGESFIDTSSGRTVDVFYDPKSGQRQYVARGNGGRDDSQSG